MIGVATDEVGQLAAVQCFEISFELSWKIMRKTLIAWGKDPLNSPRTVFREAAENKLIDNPEIWFVFLEYRNQTIHTYNAELLDTIIGILPQFRDALRNFIERLERMA